MKADFNTNEKLYSIGQLADMFSISKTSIYRMVEQREISFYKIKGSIRFNSKDISDYLDKNRVEKVN